MKYSCYLLVMILIVFQSCKGADKDVPAMGDEIVKLEEQYNAKKDINNANALLTKYAEFTAANPDDTENNGRYLRRSAQIYNSTKEYMKAAATTVLALKQFYGSRETEANVASLVDYYRKLGNSDAAETTMNGYIMAFPNGSNVTKYSNDLGDKKQNLVDRLTTLANDIVQSPDDKSGFNTGAVDKFVGVAEIYALTNNTRDTSASDYLFKAGKLAMTIGNLDKAMECYHWIYTSLKSSKEAPSALFTHAFTLDNQLGRKDEARGLYEQFLNLYPNHHFADDAAFQLKNLGKNDAEIIEEFNKSANSK